MPNSKRWLTASAPCRLEWKPSRWLVGALWLLGVLGAMSVLMSEMPRIFAIPSSLAALAYGAWLARREAGKPARLVAWQGDGPVTLDGLDVDAVSLQWRGPLAFLQWRDRNGHRQRLAWWPDTLGPRGRRELRLAAERRDASRRAPQMAR